jgi:hypothetical protein
VSRSGRLSIDLRDSARGQARIDQWRDILVRLSQRQPGPFHHAIAARDQLSEFDFRSAAESLLPGAVFHLQREAEAVQARVHRFMKDRGTDLGIRKSWVHRERQLHETRLLLVEVRSAAREALDEDIREIALQVSEVVRNVTLDQRQRAVNARERVIGVDVRARVVDDNRNASHQMMRHSGIGFLLAEEANQSGQHVSAFNKVSSDAIFVNR